MANTVTLDDCTGVLQYVDIQCLDPSQTDLSYCRCNLCQTYVQRTIFGINPENNVNSITMTHLQQSRESQHTLCLYHWTFFRIPTRLAPNATQQQWTERDVSRSSTISTSLGTQPDTPQALIITLDTEYNIDAERFTTIDAFLHLSPTLPDDWYQVHKQLNDGTEYPRSVFRDLRTVAQGGTFVQLNQRDSFTYTLGFDDTKPGCTAPLPSDALYLAVRCGRPFGREQNNQHYGNENDPCRFRVRYMLVPMALAHGDVLGPLPIAQSTYHTYSVLVGGYDVIRYRVERVGLTNLTFGCVNDALTSRCGTYGHGLIGNLRYSVNVCPTRGGQAMPILNSSAFVTREWFCTQPWEGGRYFIAIEAR